MDARRTRSTASSATCSSERLATQAELAEIVGRGSARELDAEVDLALASPLPPPERALEGVYEEGRDGPRR